MNINPIIRRYSDIDKNAVIELFRINTPEYFSIEEEPSLLYYLNNHSRNHYIVESGNEIVGCGGFNHISALDVGEICWDIIHPHHQGKGYGKKLLNFRIEKLKELYLINNITVRTSQLVYKFYEKNGFILREQVKNYWAVGFDLYIMEYPIINDLI